MTEQEQAVLDRWQAPLPKHMLNEGHKPGRGVLAGVVGWLLLDWFVKPQVKIKTIEDNGSTYHMVGITRFGEAHSFILNDNAVMSLGVAIKGNTPEKLAKGFVIFDPAKIGTCTIPNWAVTDFLMEFVKVYLPTANRFLAEMELATKNEEGKPANVTVH